MRAYIAFAALLLFTSVNAASLTWQNTSTYLSGSTQMISTPVSSSETLTSGRQHYADTALARIVSTVDGSGRASADLHAGNHGIDVELETLSLADSYYSPYEDDLYASTSGATARGDYTFSLDEAADLHMSFDLLGISDFTLSHALWNIKFKLFEVGNATALVDYEWDWYTYINIPSPVNGQEGYHKEDFLNLVQLAAGDYKIDLDLTSSATAYEGDGGGISRMRFKASVIPIPPALVLFPSALAALGWMRRRKQG
jgi:hypothetical protein